jgi:N6-adenosine-specific RNA methylase IME4
VSAAQELVALGECEMSRTGLVIPSGLDFEQWQSIGSRLREIEGAVLWWIGDWLNYGEAKYGETYTQALDATDYSYETLRQAKWVAGQYELCDRSHNLSWLHHRYALSAPDPRTALSWAVKNKASAAELKRHIRGQQIASIGAEFEASTPAGQYHVIVLDPPWRYDGGELAHDAEGFRGVTDYPTMALEEIAAIELPTADDCVLWFWTTHRFMRHALDMLQQWGFEEKAVLTWVKDRMGIGRWLRSKSEFCVMAVRGSPPVNLTNQTTVLEAPLREHSRKPDEFYALVNELCVGRKLDYFSREKRDGWDQYGNDADRF